MKLYLASHRLGEYPEKFRDLLYSVTSNKKIALITNGLDYTSNYFELTQSVKRDERDIKALGLEVEKIDLRDYFGKAKKLKQKLVEFNAVYVRGGNVFVLRRAFEESGLDKILIDLISKDDFVYAGFGSGVCVLGPALQGFEYVYDPKIDPEGYKKQTINEGLGFIDYSVVPHFRSDHKKSQQMNLVVDYFLNNAVKFVALTDNDVIITDLKEKK